ncbi:ATP-dependent RNA helicase [Wickerhamomyces ciferrii]|uniref:RNA helicase n=1 Tax=Wickerhamomyces ciferrii (strain ATCC 14091 / BCRC 22168 / CBS 111 / JCM 3599 / NBRC 0793 / NRRL Y-1031 F-60-10) TaxID=1206466 RepID=K0KS38_WICCF|nr:ATP-dependent RNA helicase [Wickerhamomyces ciferrii]CCH44787.1 ATP-dependent RNA helicase [Wickerhamomyces ciferrii]
MSDFKSIGVSRWLSESLNAMRIYTPTAIQKACHDCIGGAKTGSGKTIAFGAPMLTKWSEDPMGIFGLVLTPTRELALQIAEQFAALGAAMNIRIAVIVGGESMVEQAIKLQGKPHFVIATPGRLADHILNSGEDTIEGLKRVRYLVLDEADRLLSNSFGSDLQRCFSILPSADKRQTLLFTATVTDAVRALKDRPTPTNKPKLFIHEVDSVDKVAIPSQLETYFMLVPSYVKESYLYSILSHEDNEKKTAMVFVNRTHTAEVVRRTLRNLEIRVASLHSELPQQERTNSLHRFRANAARVLIATDVASRGLDIPDVELVINYDIPADPDDFVHRVGRTARAGRKGQTISLVSEKDVSRIQAIEERINKKLDKYEKITDNKVIKKSLQSVSIAKREAEAEMSKEEFGERKRTIKRKSQKDDSSNYKIKKPKNKSRK